MENEKKNICEIENMENLKIGKEAAQIQPKKVIIEDFQFENVKFEKQNNENIKIKFLVRHPDVKDKLLEISKLVYLADKKVKISGIWLKLDSDGNIPFKSAIAELLRFAGMETIPKLKGLEIETMADENGYLVLKAY